VPSNIVEGCSRPGQVDYCHFLDLAYGSLKELHYQFGLAFRLGFIDDSNAKLGELKIVETEKVLAALIRGLRK
jgi:four helix bundle protein